MLTSIITVDTSTSPGDIDAHGSTQGLTTLLHNDQLILVEVQGTLEYNLTKGEEPLDIRLGDITWDEMVYSTLWRILILGFEGVFTYWTSQNDWTSPIPQKPTSSPARKTECTHKLIRRQRLAVAYCDQEETGVRYSSGASLSRPPPSIGKIVDIMADLYEVEIDNALLK